jgi:hypothetical protein
VTLIGQFHQRISMMFGTTDGIFDPFKYARSGIILSQVG